MDIMKMATEALMSKLGGSVDAGTIQKVLTNLIGGSGGGLDIGSLIGSMKAGGLASMAQSWLGDGANDSVSGNQLLDMFGADKVKNAAAELGTSQDTLLDALKDVVPNMVDKSSSGGSLLDSVGGLSGLAGKFF